MVNVNILFLIKKTLKMFRDISDNLCFDKINKFSEQNK